MVDPVMISTSGDVLVGPSVLAGFLYVFLNLNCSVSVSHQSIIHILQSSQQDLDSNYVSWFFQLLVDNIKTMIYSKFNFIFHLCYCF